MRSVIGAVAVVVVVCAVAWIVLTSSPTPGALIIRGALNSQSAATKKAMEKYVIQDVRRRVGVLSDLQYAPGDPDALLDLYLPISDAYSADEASRNGRSFEAGDDALLVGARDGFTDKPTVVWIHGGGWLSGDKGDAAPYFKILAASGFPVVSIDYPLAPEHRYPEPVVAINRALGYLAASYSALHLSNTRFVLAGDSAGAQLASQVAALTTNAAYAEQLGITPALPAKDLVGAVLDCGVYDASPFKAGSKDAPKGPLGFAVATLMWAYAGTKDTASPIFDEMSTIHHVTAAFPPTFITGGNADPLTAGQSKPLAAKFRGLGVDTTTRFFPAGHTPKLEHEYQFDLDTADARATLQATIAFLQSRSRA